MQHVLLPGVFFTLIKIIFTIYSSNTNKFSNSKIFFFNIYIYNPSFFLRIFTKIFVKNIETRANLYINQTLNSKVNQFSNTRSIPNSLLIHYSKKKKKEIVIKKFLFSVAEKKRDILITIQFG